jgi:hypothetical protein
LGWGLDAVSNLDFLACPAVIPRDEVSPERHRTPLQILRPKYIIHTYQQGLGANSFGVIASDDGTGPADKLIIHRRQAWEY